MTTRSIQTCRSRAGDELRALAEAGAAEVASGTDHEAAATGVIAWVARNFGVRTVAVACSIGVAVESHTNSVQDQQRITDQRERTATIAHVTDCIRDFAAELGDNLPPVRRATARRDSALRTAMGKDPVLGEPVRTQVDATGSDPLDTDDETGYDGYAYEESYDTDDEADHSYDDSAAAEAPMTTAQS